MTVRAVAFAAVLGLLGCAPEPADVPAAVVLEPVPAPDFAVASAAVRDQVGAQFDGLVARGENTERPAAERAAAYGELGRLLMAVNLTGAAQPAILNAHRLAPSDPRWAYYLGHLRRGAGDYGAAADYFSATLRLQPDHVPSLVWLGRVHLAAGNNASAEEAFTRALARAAAGAAAAAAHGGLGQVALARREFAAAIRHFERALASEPAASINHYRLALAHRGAGDSAAAATHLARRGDLDADPPDPWMEELRLLVETPGLSQKRGVLALQYGAFPQAAEHFRRGLDLGPEDRALRVALLHGLGTALRRMGDLAGAAARFEEGLTLDPQYAPHHAGLGDVLAAQGSHAAAVARFRTALELDPGYTEARFLLAETLRVSGRAGEAIPHYEQVIAAAPQVPEARLGLVQALAAAGRRAEARAQVVRALQAYPGDPRFTGLLALLDDGAPAR